MSPKWIFGFEELSSQDNDAVGKKCANLGELTRLGLRVPPGFAISVAGYERFMTETGAGEEIKAYVAAHQEALQKVEGQTAAGRTIRHIIESKSMPFPMKQEIDYYYEELCRRVGLSRIPVAVRSSGAVSMPGQMETYLNISGKDQVSHNIIRVWGSAFTTRAIAFRLEKSLPMETSPIGVAVLKMVRAKSAGVVLTVLPTTGDTSKVIIEGNWGLGESVVSGEVTPDQFIVDKNTRDISSTINPKTRMVVYRETGTAMSDVPTEMHQRPCLDNHEIEEITRVAEQVEAHFGLPQDLEWVVDLDLPFPDNIFWVQARPAKYTQKKKENDAAYLAELMTRIFKF